MVGQHQLPISPTQKMRTRKLLIDCPRHLQEYLIQLQLFLLPY